MLKLFTKLFGTKSDRDIKALIPYLDSINEEAKNLGHISNDQLREKVIELKQQVKYKLENVNCKLDELKKKRDNHLSNDMHKIKSVSQELDLTEKQFNKQLEQSLLEILPTTFAIVKETMRRFKESSPIQVTATEFDKKIASQCSYVTIQDNIATWSNEWEVAGSKIKWDMVPHDVQLIGGVILHQGKIAEMGTGEGKTLVSILPLFLNALSGMGVHLVTVNDYLSKRDSEWNAPIFQFHGLSVDCIDKHHSYSYGRKEAYKADITYGTNNEFGFDYLRDNMVTSPEEVVQRKLHFALVDEVDSVLIDDARTPLIISGPVENSNEKDYATLKNRIEKLYEAQKNLVNGFLQEAKQKIPAGKEDEGGLALFRVYRGLPKYKPLLKYLSELGIKQILHKIENHYLQDNSILMPEADEPLLFSIDEKNNSTELTEKGIHYITQNEEDPYFFVLPDIGLEIARIESSDLDEKEKNTQKELLINDYSAKSQRIHIVNQLLKAYTLFEKDVDYILVNNKVKIVDEQTGRILEGRRYSDGLHQALEAKEGAKIEKSSQTYATITLQNYFRMYHKLAGMTGTAITEAEEFWGIYKLDSVEVPPHRPVIREDKDDKVYKTVREKFNAVIEEIEEITKQKRAVLVGTTSVETSELLSRMLSMRKINHQVLNAKRHKEEAEIVKLAGTECAVTIATNMAGRGTDIKPTNEVLTAGGLAIIGTERHESRRIDRQLRGRSGRQGNKGSSQFFLSLEDNLMRLFGSSRIIKIMDRLGLEEGEVIQHSMVTRSIETAQKKVEQGNFATRKRLLEYDNVMNAQRTVMYKKRNNALFGQLLDLEIMSMVYDTIHNIVSYRKTAQKLENISLDLFKTFGLNYNMDLKNIDNKKGFNAVVDDIYKKTLAVYEKKRITIQDAIYESVSKKNDNLEDCSLSYSFAYGDTKINAYANMPTFQDSCIELVKNLEQNVILHYIDHLWKDHLREMDELKQAVQNAVYERQDPLLVYKLESYDLFQQLLDKVNQNIISFLYKSHEVISPQADSPTSIQNSLDILKLHELKRDIHSLLSFDNDDSDEILPPKKPRPIKIDKKASRNERVTVRYNNGTIKENVKYKAVEEDIENNVCKLV